MDNTEIEDRAELPVKDATVDESTDQNPQQRENTTVDESTDQNQQQRENTTSSSNPCRRVLKEWKKLVLLLTPLILLPIPLVWTEKPGKCAYVVAIMAVYWMTEAIPIAATALLPFALMPWLGIIKASEVAVNYLKDTNFLMVGGLLVALAIEKCNLHKRIALRVLLLVGSQPRWLLFGFMSTTAFLSMWLSNTATTAMMVPIAQAVLMELMAYKKKVKKSDNANNSIDGTKIDMEDMDDMPSDESKKEIVFPNDPDGKEANRFRGLCKGLTLSICYAANIGGVCTLTGTPPNLVLRGQLESLFGPDHGINFTTWMAFAFPVGLIALLFAWLWLNIMFIGPKSLFGCCLAKDNKEEADVAKNVIRKQYTALGSMSFAEICVLIFFILMALLWLTRDPGFVDGWSVLFEEGYISDACVAVSISVILFMWPARLPWKSSEPKAVPSLLDWKYVHHNMAWNVILVLGGSFAMADAVKKSGLSAEIGNALTEFENFKPVIIVLLLCIVTAAFTEIASNTATATIFMPILAELAKVLEVNPLYLMIPTTIATSFAFMLPVATPPNAIVFAYGHMKIIDMAKAGFVMNVICIGVLTLAVNTWGYAYFDFGTLPNWALDVPVNATTS